MKTAHFEYKCRRCGVIEENPHCGLPAGTARATILLLDAMMGKAGEPQAPTMLSLHTCEDGHCGVSDLIGYNITEE